MVRLVLTVMGPNAMELYWSISFTIVKVDFHGGSLIFIASNSEGSKFHAIANLPPLSKCDLDTKIVHIRQ